MAVSLRGLCELAGVPFLADGVVVASVVPAVNYAIHHLSRKWLKAPVKFLERGEQVGLEVDYEPSHAVGADRIANAIAALQTHKAPVVIVDFGTATTFDCVNKHGVYVGGSILPGVVLSVEALLQKTAKLPQFELQVPARAVGHNTVESLQSGVMYGYAGAIDTLASHIRTELGDDTTFVATGGLGHVFSELCKEVRLYEPNLTLDGLRLAWTKM
jgi:type III pantothenate kinase